MDGLEEGCKGSLNIIFMVVSCLNYKDNSAICGKEISEERG